MSRRQAPPVARKTVPQGVRATKRPPNLATSSKAPAAKKQRGTRLTRAGANAQLVEPDTTPTNTEEVTHGEKIDPDDSEDSDESMTLEERRAFVLGEPNAELLEYQPPSMQAPGYFPRFPVPEVGFAGFNAESVEGETSGDNRRIVRVVCDFVFHGSVQTDYLSPGLGAPKTTTYLCGRVTSVSDTEYFAWVQAGYWAVVPRYLSRSRGQFVWMQVPVQHVYVGCTDSYRGRQPAVFVDGQIGSYILQLPAAQFSKRWDECLLRICAQQPKVSPFRPIDIDLANYRDKKPDWLHESIWECLTTACKNGELTSWRDIPVGFAASDSSTDSENPNYRAPDKFVEHPEVLVADAVLGMSSYKVCEAELLLQRTRSLPATKISKGQLDYIQGLKAALPSWKKQVSDHSNRFTAVRNTAQASVDLANARAMRERAPTSNRRRSTRRSNARFLTAPPGTDAGPMEQVLYPNGISGPSSSWVNASPVAAEASLPSAPIDPDEPVQQVDSQPEPEVYAQSAPALRILSALEPSPAIDTGSAPDPAPPSEVSGPSNFTVPSEVELDTTHDFLGNNDMELMGFSPGLFSLEARNPTALSGMFQQTHLADANRIYGTAFGPAFEPHAL